MKMVSSNLERPPNKLKKLKKLSRLKVLRLKKKKNDAEKFAAVVGVEKEKVEKENDKANTEASKCQ